MQIRSSIRDYDVHFEAFDQALAAAARIPNVITLCDARVLELYRGRIEGALKGPIFPIVAREENKSFEQVGEYIVQLLSSGARKNSHLLVIGGGILQDIGGFIASILYRGVEWTLIPTTLLAQCDSCIGSKTSMNISKFKNQLGTFYPPRSVRIAGDVLRTLEPGDLDSGACEAVKLAMIEGNAAVDEMRAALRDGLTPKALEAIVRQSLDIKKVYIEEDEYDRGRRNILNYGHTFAHAFESTTQYQIPHGVAVGLGIEAAVFFSMQLGFVNEAHYADVRSLLRPLTDRSREQLLALAPEDLVKVMKTDKKNTSADVTFILSRGYGQMFKQPLSAEKAQSLLQAYLAQ